MDALKHQMPLFILLAASWLYMHAGFAFLNWAPPSRRTRSMPWSRFFIHRGAFERNVLFHWRRNIAKNGYELVVLLPVDVCRSHPGHHLRRHCGTRPLLATTAGNCRDRWVCLPIL